MQRNGAWTLIPPALVLALLSAPAVTVAISREGHRATRIATAAVAIPALLALVLITGGGVLPAPEAIMLSGCAAPGARPGPPAGAALSGPRRTPKCARNQTGVQAWGPLYSPEIPWRTPTRVRA